VWLNRQAIGKDFIWYMSFRVGSGRGGGSTCPFLRGRDAPEGPEEREGVPVADGLNGDGGDQLRRVGDGATGMGGSRAWWTTGRDPATTGGAWGETRQEDGGETNPEWYPTAQYPSPLGNSFFFAQSAPFL